MDWQQIVALAIVALAAAWLAWSKLRPRKFSFQKDTPCGCGGGGGQSGHGSIVFRARKGERPEIIVKMK